MLSPASTGPQLLDKMRRNETGRLLVVHDGKLSGMLSREGLLRFVSVREVLDDVDAGRVA